MKFVQMNSAVLVFYYLFTVTSSTPIQRTRRLSEVERLLGSWESDRVQPYYMFAQGCEGTQLTISCGYPYDRTISIVRATYGNINTRQSGSTCPRSGSSRFARCPVITGRPRRIVSDICNEQAQCNVMVSSRIFGDPCPNTPKQLDVYYSCVEDNS